MQAGLGKHPAAWASLPTAMDLTAAAGALLEAGQNPAPAMESSPEWQELKHRLPQKHDLLFLLLEDLIAQSPNS